MLDSGSTLEIIQFIIGIVLIISVYFIVIRIIYNKKRISKLTGDDLKFDKIKSIYKQIKKGEDPKATTIKKHAENLEYRTLVYHALKKFNKTNLFPESLLTIEKSSESYLANWLDMNDHFDCFPDEIKYKDTIELQNGVTLLIFKFKVYEPHQYANKDWIIGYVGYKSTNINAYQKPLFILSKFENELIPKNQLEKFISSSL